MLDVDSWFENKVIGEQNKGRVVGRLDIRFCNQKHRTQLAYLYQDQPLRALFPTDPAVDNLAVWINMAGGVVGGDHHYINVECGKDAAAMVTGQAAEKIYRSSGEIAQLAQSVTVAPGSWLEWLPQGTILFDGCRLRRINRFNVSPGGRLLVGEIITFGRTAMGEKLRSGLVRDDWRLYRNGKIHWADCLHIDNDMHRIFQTSAGFYNSRAMGLCLYAADDASKYIDDARQILLEQRGKPNETYSGASALNRLLLVRWLARDPAQLRVHFGTFWAKFRSIVSDNKATLPSLWHI